jgi:hypothetical protein
MLAAGEPIEGHRPFSAAEVIEAFSSVFESAITVGGNQILGTGFETTVSDGRPYVQVACSWKLGATPEREFLEARFRRVATRLRAILFDPQVSRTPGARKIAETPGRARDAPAKSRPANDVPGPLAELGTPTSEDHFRLDEDRAQSFGRIQRWLITGLDEGTGAIHSAFLRESGKGLHPNHEYQPKHLTDVVCHYVRLVQSVLPFDILVASGSGRAKDGAFKPFSNRVIGIVDGKVGMLGSLHNTLVKDGDLTISRWTQVVLAEASSTLKLPTVVATLTEVVATAARDAHQAALRGQTRPLRDWLALMVAVDSGGMATEELLPSEVPSDQDGARGFRVLDSGAIMPLWTQRPFAAFRVEASLSLAERGRFELDITPRDRRAARRHRFDPPLGTGR